MGVLEQGLAFSLFVTLELAVYVAAVFCVLVKGGHRRAGAFSLSIVLVLAAVSLALQTLFLAGGIRYLVWLEAAGWVFSLYRVGRSMGLLAETARDLFRLARPHPVLSSLVSVSLLYLGFQAFLLPSGNHDSLAYNLARVLLWQQEHTLLLTSYTVYQQAAFPVGGDILFHLFLRRHTDFGVGAINFLAYLSIGAGVFQIAAASYSRRIAAVTSLAAMSLPELVYQATSTKPDILVAAVAVALLVLADRLLRAPVRKDFDLVLFLLLFGVSIKMTFWAFAIPFLAFVPVALWRAHCWNGVGGLLRGNPARWLYLLLAALVFSQVWLFLYNYSVFGGILGPPTMTAHLRNNDGIPGTVANLVKYALQAIHLLAPVDWLVRQIGGPGIPELLGRTYETTFAAFAGDLGGARTADGAAIRWPFTVNWRPHEDFSWFGPLGAFAVVPAIFHCLFRGAGIFRLVSLLCIANAALLASQIAWMPWNGRFFSAFFAAGSVCLAPVLGRWNSRHAERLLIGVALPVFLYAVFFNGLKPAAQSGWDRVGNVWTATSFGGKRDRWYADPYDDRRLDRYAASVRRGARVVVFCRRGCQLYPVMMKRPDIRVEARSKAHLDGDGRLDPGRAEYLFCLDDSCDGVRATDGRVLWRSEPGSKLGGELIELR